MDRDRPSDVWERGDAYERYVGRWSRRVAPLFLAWLRIPAGRRWLDIGCGTGALAATIADHCSPAWLGGVEPSQGFLATARRNLAADVVLAKGSAAEIPLGDSSVDVSVSGLVLNFVPDHRAALAEMARVTGDGGTVGAYVWDYAGKMELMRVFWDAALEVDPDAARFHEGSRFSMCEPEALRGLFSAAGLGGAEVTPIDITTPFATFEDYWEPFLGGQGVAPVYVVSLDETKRERLRDRVRERLPIRTDGSISLTARAWAIRATVAKRAAARPSGGAASR